MKILVTGASGFTGSHFVAAARAAGHEVALLRARLQERAGIAAELLVHAPQAVVHLAAVSASTVEPAAYYEVNTVGATNLLDALCELPAPPRKVLLVSSANVYGSCGDQAIAESCAPVPVDHYGMSKLAMEHLSRSYCPHLPVIISRPFNYTGVGQRCEFVIPKLVKLFAERAPLVELGSLDVRREFIDVRFVCAAMLRLLEVGEPGSVYNICRGSAVSLHEVLALLTHLTGHAPTVVSNPALLRRSDIAWLHGDPRRLDGAIGALATFSLEDTLRWMLASAAGESA